MCKAWRVKPSVFAQWDPDDRHKVVMHQIRELEICSGCGTHPDDWDPARGGFVDAYVAEICDCRGCAALERERRSLEQRPRPGASARLRRFDPDADDSLGGGERG